MDMCYDGALVMPSSYAVMNEEEMTYVEGGGFFQKVMYEGVKLAANVAFNAILGGGAITLLRKIISSSKDLIKKTLISVFSKWLSTKAANIYAGSILGCIFDFGVSTIGGAVAEAIDRWDGDNDNQIYFSRIRL